MTETIKAVQSVSTALFAGWLVLPGVFVWGQSPVDQRRSESSKDTSTAVSRIDEGQLVGLPLNGRSYSSLATLQAGVSQTSDSSGSRGTSSGGLTVAGGRSTSNTFLMDGTNIMSQDNTVPRSAAGVQLGSDAVLQVQVFSTVYSAEYGRDSGGVLNSITRSGTPQLHGSLFEYFRNSKLDSRDLFDPAEPPPFKRNQFGFLLTGPIQSDRTFFMGSFEAMRDRLSQTDINFVPDEQTRSRTDINPRVKQYLLLYPQPNAGSLGGGVGEVRAPHFLPTDENFFTVRIDHQVSQHNSFFTRYSFDEATSKSAEDTYLFTTQVKSRQQYLTVANTHIFSLAAINTARFGYTRSVPDTTSISSIEIPRDLFFVPDAPTFGAIVIPGLASFGPATTNPQHKGQRSFQFSDDLLLQRGSHGLKLGAEVHRYHWDVSSNRHKGAEWSFNSLESFLQAGPEETTTLRVSLPGSDSAKDYRQTLLGFFIQDEYKARPGLQLSLGLRYEFVTLIHDENGRDSFLADPLHDAEVRVGPLLDHNPSLKNFAPRLGITWSPWSGKDTVVNAGFGVFYDQILQYLVDRQKTSLPFYKLVLRPNFDSSNIFPDAVAAAANTPLATRVLSYHDITTPMVLRYNLSVQQPLSAGWRFQASYVGARGNHLFRTSENNLFPVPVRQSDGSLLFPPYKLPGPDNRVNPAFGSVEFITSDAQSFYNSLQVSANKSLSHGLSFQMSYALSKSVDDASQVSPDSVQYGWIRTLERGLSDFSIRHRLSMNYFYNLPSWSGGQPSWPSRILGNLLGGWRLGGIVSLRAGTPLTAQVSVRRPGYLFSANRPNLVAGASNNPTDGTSAGCAGVTAGRELGGPNLYFDPCSFSVPAAGTLGNLGRNTLTAPRVISMDISLQKEFLLDTKRRLQFRAEFFNIPNHTNLGRASTTVFTGSTGRLSSTAGKIRSTATTARQIQFALRLSF